MSYEERLELATDNVIRECKEILSRNWNRVWFDHWLRMDGDMAFGDCYTAKFKEQFADYINNDIEY